MTMNHRSILRVASTTAALFLFLVGADATFAQDVPAKDPTDVKQLNDRVELLEQTIKELKDQLTAIEEAKKNPKVEVIDATYKADGSAPIGTLTTGTGTTAGTAVPAKKKAEDVNDTTFEIYGFAMLDAGYQFGSNHPDWYDTLRVTQLPSFKGQYGEGGKTYWGVRQSRLGVKSSTPTKYGDLKTVFEFELFGTGVDAGQTTFRLRHAYGEVGTFGAGQYWSPFTDPDAFPNSLEYWGPTGLAWFRNVQIRWTPIRKADSSLILALERPGASGDQGVYSDRIELQNIRARFPIPDFSAAYKYSQKWGYLRLADQLREIKWDDVLQDNFDLSGSATGWGLNLASNVNA